jgi:putative sigma-54 modulation protein
MQLQIITKNIEVSEAIKKQINKKISKLDHHLPSLVEGKVEISKRKSRQPEQRFAVQVTLDSKGTLIRAHEYAVDILTAIDNVMDALNKRIERYKGKLYEKRKGVSLERQGTGQDEEKTNIYPEVVKSKHFFLKPMSIEEATEQLELLGHDFFLFIDAETSKVSMLYSRKDGNYGIIIVETE